jgi:parallel beta-helix repeat protein
MYQTNIPFRRAVIALLAMGIHAAHATDYFVDSSVWVESKLGSQSFPWKTLDTVNSAPLKSGDRVLFRRDRVWEGTLKVKDGVSYSSYPDNATLSAPVIRASSNVGSLKWTKYSGEIYWADVTSLVRSETDVSGTTFDADIPQVIFNTLRLQRARYPFVTATGAGTGVFGQGKNRFLRLAGGVPQLESTSQVMAFEPGALPASLLPSDLAGAQVLIKNAPWVMTRYNLISADSAKATANLVADATWPGTRYFSLTPGFGYWLENKIWMLHDPGQWIYDGSGPVKKLYVWLPKGGSPAGSALYASTRVHAVEGRNVPNVSISNLVVGESRGDAVAINGATSSVKIDQMSVVRAGAMGIAVTNNGSGTGTISGSFVSDSKSVGIYLGSNSTKNINVVNNAVINAGIGYFAGSGIWLGHGSTATGNWVDKSSYIGIHVGKADTVSDNLITNSCMEFDDCGGIYARGLDYDAAQYGLAYPNDVGGTISNNFLDGALLANAPDRVDGLPNVPANLQASASNGIYLDDFTGSVTVTNNYVTGFDTGMLLHYGRNNTVNGNTLVGNLRNQLFLQENKTPKLTRFDTPDFCGAQPSCDANNYLRGNTFNGNLMVSSSSNAVIVHSSDFAGEDDFALYTGNFYGTYGTPTFAVIQSNVPADKSFALWQQSIPAGQDTGSTNLTSFGIKGISGAKDVIVNGSFDASGSDWNIWHGAGVVTEAASCFNGTPCLSVSHDPQATKINGRYAFIMYTNPTPITQGQQYMVVFDAKALNPGETVRTALRDAVNFGDKSNPVDFSLSATWQTYKAVLTVNGTTNGRLDFEFHADGEVRVDNVRLVPVQPAVGAGKSVGFYNSGTAAKSIACPVSDVEACTRFVDVKDPNTLVSFPFNLPGKSSRVLVRKDPI